MHREIASCNSAFPSKLIPSFSGSATKSSEILLVSGLGYDACTFPRATVVSSCWPHTSLACWQTYHNPNLLRILSRNCIFHAVPSAKSQSEEIETAMAQDRCRARLLGCSLLGADAFSGSLLHVTVEALMSTLLPLALRSHPSAASYFLPLHTRLLTFRYHGASKPTKTNGKAACS